MTRGEQELDEYDQLVLALDSDIDLDEGFELDGDDDADSIIYGYDIGGNSYE